MKPLLQWLESESVAVLREAYAQYGDRCAILFSGGKDSLVLLELSRRAFFPAPIPFQCLHVDTGHNFPETLAFRDATAKRYGLNLIVRTVEETIRLGRAQDESGPYPSRNRQQSVTLLDAVRELGLLAAIGGARRDEEKARAKERFFSVRNDRGAWDPKSQRPEFWNLWNGSLLPGQQMRVFPLNNWREEDVWEYIELRKLEVPQLYFTHQRKCVQRSDGIWLAASPWISPQASDRVVETDVRFRTVGDMTCTSPVFSGARTISEIIAHIRTKESSERGSRADDQRSEYAMEERKREGYF